MEEEITAFKLPYSFAKKHRVLIEREEDEKPLVLYYGEIEPITVTELQRYLKQTFQIKQIDEDAFQTQLAKQYEMDSGQTALVLEGMEQSIDLTQLIDDLPQTEDLLDTQDDAPVIRLLNALFNQAIREVASDIHIETFEKGVIVRMRVDGVLRVVLNIPRALAPLVVSRIKVMAKLDIAEKRIPQDGRLAVKIGDHSIDVRISTMPSNHGERIVMRILDKKSSKLDLSLLGMTVANLDKMRSLITAPHGIILVTGPTGSGKTTSLYAMLNDLNEDSRNILTIEDPIEYDLPGIGQTQVNTKIQMTFAKGLRAMLRQDPDIVMVGEIRDLETAEIAVQASLTGHLVLSTLHTNTALSAVTRLNDMGVESFLLSSSLQGLVAQRLVRRLCMDCRECYETDEAERVLLKLDKPTQIYRANGCENCNQQGYLGRMGIYEVLIIDEQLRTHIHNQEPEHILEKHVRKTSPSITMDGFTRVIEGFTTIEEVLRVCKL
jgi:general secretion pathway protein E